MCLDFCRSTHQTTPIHLCEVTTPLRHAAWSQALAGHPDLAFTGYITNGLEEEYWRGFQQTSDLRSAAANMQSAREHPGEVTKYIQEDLSWGHLVDHSMAKVDFESAYRLIPVYPQDCLLQDVVWDGRGYLDPITIRPWVYAQDPNAMADAHAWLVRSDRVSGSAITIWMTTNSWDHQVLTSANG